MLLAAFLVVQWLTQDREPLVPFALFRDRNYSVVNWVSGVLAIGMMGIFLPFTIYLQSVLGFSALKAGLTMAPASVISIFVAPVAGRMTDKIGGKYILMSGLTLFALGMGWMALIAHPDSSWPVFLAPLIVAGIGMGCTFAPLITTAMRNIDPRMAGAASGVLNTVRQVGLVIGTAAVGALLQNRLVSSMTSQAATRAAALPAQDPGPVRHRDPQLGQERHPGRGRPERRHPARSTACRPAWPPRSGGSATTSSPSATWTPCARPCCCRWSCCWSARPAASRSGATGSRPGPATPGCRAGRVGAGPDLSRARRSAASTGTARQVQPGGPCP